MWLSKGDGTFQVTNKFLPWNSYQLNANSYDFKIKDLNGDGKSDMIHYVNKNEQTKYWLSNGDGTFDGLCCMNRFLKIIRLCEYQAIA